MVAADGPTKVAITQNRADNKRRDDHLSPFGVTETSGCIPAGIGFANTVLQSSASGHRPIKRARSSVGPTYLNLERL